MNNDNNFNEKKTMIAIPCMHTIDVGFAMSLEGLNRVGLTSVAYNSGSLVYASREELCQKAFQSGVDYILWLDSDMVFPKDTLENLLKDMDECDIATGLCFRRKEPFTPAIWKKVRLGLTFGETEIEEYNDYPKDSLFDIDACGMACCLMKTEVARNVFDKYSTCFQRLRNFGEDISFCIRAKQLGFSIKCDSRVKIGHIGKVVIREEQFLAYQELTKGESNA